MSENLAISARTTRLNSIILGRPETLKAEQKEICKGISREGLLDALFVLYEECNKDAIKKKSTHITEFATKYRSVIRETKMLRVNPTDFVVKTQIGSGYFGEVHLVSDKYSHDVFAMKKIKKTMVSSFQVREERDIMVLGRKSEWITILQYAFQDKEHLYLVMEYLPGGDLLSLMIRNGAFDEQLAKFYLAELALALNALHSLGFVHRDIKPENILLDRFGHLKLADFGSAIALNEDGIFTNISPVGTPEYIAPELLQILSTKGSQKQQKLDSSCDFWSMGIIGFEMITEQTPFHSDNVFDTYSEIQNYSDETRLMQVLEFPEHIKMSRNIKDLLNGLITKPSRRMTFEEVQDHPFFNGINWHKLRDQTPPIIPTLSGDDDTSNFEDVDKSLKRTPVLKKSTFAPIRVNEFSGEDLPFLGYTYTYEEHSKFLKTKSSEVQLESKLSTKIGDLQVTIKEQMREIKLLQKELLSAEKKAAQMNSLQKIHGETRNDVDSMKNQMKDKIAELAACKTEVKTLKSSLKIEEEMRLKNDSSIAEVLSQTYHKWEKAKKTSDQNYEKQIGEKKSEISGLIGRIQARDSELTAKVEECGHLQTTVEKFKDMLKNSKDQNVVDKTDYEDIRKQLSETFESKINELKQKLKVEKEQRQKFESSLQEMRKQLDEAIRSKNVLMEAQEKADKLTEVLRRQLNEKIDETKRLNKDKMEVEHQNEELNKTNDEMRKEMLKLQEENFKKQMRLSKIVSQPITVGGRCSNDGEFKSAHGSLTELDKIDNAEELLKIDLQRAKENENIQRKRADNLEEVVNRLEEMVKQSNKIKENTAGGLLERQNVKLEDQLAESREQAIIDRQSARTANLSLWKLEKELNDIKHEKTTLSKRLEMVNEKSSKAIHDKESVELKLNQQIDTLSIKETQIIDLQKDIRTMKYELKSEREKWTNIERERLREKTEIIEGNSKIKNLEEKLRELSIKQKQIEQKYNCLVNEKDNLETRLTDEQNLYCNTQETLNELQGDLDLVNRNYEMLKEACSTTEHQLNVVENMWQEEVKRNKENCEKIDGLWSKVRGRDDEITKLKVDLSQEKALKMTAETKGCQLQNESDELTEEMQAIQKQMIEMQQQLVKKQKMLLATEENIEITNSDLHHMQKLKLNYENELVILKEENSKILTDLYLTKEEVRQLSMELKDAKGDMNDLNVDKDHLNGLLAELRTHSRERDIKADATVTQQKKLIDYLQERVEELQNKKKKTLADKLFGANIHVSQTPKSARKENVPPNVADTAKMRRVEEDLKRERERNQRLKENLMRTKMEIRKSAGMTSPEREVRESTVESNDQFVSTAKTVKATIHANPEVKLQNESRQRESTASTPKSHHFAMTIETASPAPNAPSTLCLACERIILIGQPYWQCKECKLSVHRKCRGCVKSNCLLYDGASTTSASSSSAATTATLNDSRKKMNLDDVDGIEALPDDNSSDGMSDVIANNYYGDHILNSTRFGFGWAFATTPVVNAVYELNDKITLFGCSNGLFSYHLEENEIVQIKGISSVNYFSIKSNLTKSILIGDDGEHLFECDMRMLTNKSQASNVLEPKLNIQPIDLTIANQCGGNEKWHILELHGTNDQLFDAVAIAATASRMVILKYDAKIGRFKPVRSLDTAKAITSILFTQHSAIVSCDKFFEIDLSSFVAEEFLDMSDQSLRPTRTCHPMNVFRINSREFLMCFREYGVYVDEYGLRARPENLEWIHEPIEFFYKNYLLYIIHEDMVQIMRINNSYTKHELNQTTDNNQARTFVLMNNEKKFTHNGSTGQYCVNLLRKKGMDDGDHVTQDLIKIDAEKAFKVNENRSLGSIISSSSSTSLATLASNRSSLDTIN